ncbi:SubName: Full=Uncharacterized protein {ECO:0000313/EMBL:CCA74084.1} [Serendipita indica DSM 11827]|nr:SubName: Full=Uncharacterized protein {ECO:0000313/EMBL:CCA74084.1} [Serendipita indica DSM 11827]
MSSSVTCDYVQASWEVNAAGQDACVQYASLIGLCDSSFTIAGVQNTSAPYTPPQGAGSHCGCNTVAYNLMAACGWCQKDIEVSWWLTLDQWAGNCTTANGGAEFTEDIPDTVNTTSLTIPNWALMPPVLDTWSPAQASAVAAAATATSTSSSNSRASSSTSSRGILGGNVNLAYTTARPVTVGSSNGNYYGSNTYTYYDPKIGLIVAILIFALYGLGAIIFAICYCVRQKRRKAWYGPMAKYYRELKLGGPSHYPMNASYNTPYTPPTHYQDPSHSYPPHPAHGQGGATTPLMHNNDHDHDDSVHNTNPFNTPYASTYSSHVPPPDASYAQGGLGYQTQGMYGGQSNPYGPPAGPPPPSGPYKGHAEAY